MKKRNLLLVMIVIIAGVCISVGFKVMYNSHFNNDCITEATAGIFAVMVGVKLLHKVEDELDET